MDFRNYARYFFRFKPLFQSFPQQQKRGRNTSDPNESNLIEAIGLCKVQGPHRCLWRISQLRCLVELCVSRVNSGLNGVNGGVLMLRRCGNKRRGGCFREAIWQVEFSVPKNIRGWLGLSLHQFSTNGKSSSWFGCSAGTVNGWMIWERCEMLWVK